MTRFRAPAPQAAPQPTVWILDDSPAEAEAIRRALATGCKPEVFTDGAVLIEALGRRTLPDLLVLDWELPGLSGIEVCQFLRGTPATEALPIIMLTGHRLPEDVAEGLTAGANDYVFKPFNTVELSARVLALVRWDVLRREAERQKAEAHAHRLAEEQARRQQAEATLERALKAEAALRASELRLRRIAETGIVGILTWDTAGDITEANDAFLRMVGYSREDLEAGRLKFRELTPPEYHDVTEKAVRSLQETGVVMPFEKQYRRKDGSRVDVLMSSASLDESRRRGIALVFDITERKRAEAALQEEARRRADFERQLIGIVSHDLRTPLSAITLSASMLQRSKLDARQTRSVERVLTAAGRASRLIRDLLDFTQARLGAGIPLQRQPANLHALAQAAVDEVQPAHPERHIELVRQGGGDGTWDADRISQVLSNLVGNALHYSPPDTPVRVETRTDADEAVLQVHNAGEPIPAEALARIFEPLERGVEPPDVERRSIGLGLFIVDQIVRAHGGRIEVRSQAGSGTTFTVRLPRA